jgi:antitoxin YefM
LKEIGFRKTDNLRQFDSGRLLNSCRCFSDLASTYEKTYASHMATLTASDARSNLYRLIDQTAESHQPILIVGKRSNAVLLSEQDWAAIQETLHLLSVPGMRESIKAGMAEPIDSCSTELDW